MTLHLGSTKMGIPSRKRFAAEQRQSFSPWQHTLRASSSSRSLAMLALAAFSAAARSSSLACAVTGAALPTGAAAPTAAGCPRVEAPLTRCLSRLSARRRRPST